MGLEVRKLSREMLEEELVELERRHGRSSAECYEQYRTGALGDEADSPEFVRWAGLCYMAVRNGVLQLPTVHT